MLSDAQGTCPGQLHRKLELKRSSGWNVDYFACGLQSPRAELLVKYKMLSALYNDNKSRVFSQAFIRGLVTSAFCEPLPLKDDAVQRAERHSIVPLRTRILTPGYHAQVSLRSKQISRVFEGRPTRVFLSPNPRLNVDPACSYAEILPREVVLRTPSVVDVPGRERRSGLEA